MRCGVAGIAVAAILTCCTSDPEAKKRQLLQTGNAYYEKGKYKEASLIYRRALQYDRRFAEAYYRLGLAEVAAGRYAEAMQALQRAADLEPGNPEVFERLSDLYLAFYQSDPKRMAQFLDEAQALTERAEAYRVEPRRTRRVRGFVEIGRGHLDRAIELLREARRLDPAEKRVVLGLAGALGRRGDYAEAERVLEETIGADPVFGPAYDLLYELELRQQRPAKAEAVLRRKCAADPKNLAVWLQLAAHYQRAGQAAQRDQVLERLSRQPAEFPGALLAAGDFYLRIGEAARAIELYRRGAESDKPAERLYRLRLAQALAFQGRTGEALEAVGQVLDSDGQNEEARHLRAALLVERGDAQAVKEAIRELESLLAKQRTNPVLRYNLGRAYLAAGDLDKAAPQFQEAAQVREYLAPRYELGRIYLVKNQPELAVQLAGEILELQPDSIAGALLKATALLRTHNAQSARRVLEEVLKRQPDNRQAQYLLATLNVQERKFREAEPVLRRLAEAAPEDPRYWWGLTQLYAAQGRTDQALETLTRQLERDPRSLEVRLARATVAANAKRYSAAIADFTEILKDHPNDARVHERLGTTYYLAGDLAAAERHYRKAREANPTSLTATLRLALLAGELGQKEEAKVLLREVLNLAPDHPVALNNLADLLAESPSDLDEALTLAQKAYRRAPDNAKIAETLGAICVKKNLNDEAIRIFDQLAARRPSEPRLQYQLAMAHLQKGDKAHAREILEKALRARPPKGDEEKIRQLLAQAR
jgi:tetratricopeptide (TPR) repeat protein